MPVDPNAQPAANKPLANHNDEQTPEAATAIEDKNAGISKYAINMNHLSGHFMRTMER